MSDRAALLIKLADDVDAALIAMRPFQTLPPQADMRWLIAICRDKYRLSHCGEPLPLSLVQPVSDTAT